METINKDSFHQQLLDRAYSQWDDESYPEFIDSLEPALKAAVLLANLNYQVMRGGFSRWHAHGYSSVSNELLDVLRGMDGAITAVVYDLVRDVVRTLKAGLSGDSLRLMDEVYKKVSLAFLSDCEIHFLRQYRKFNEANSSRYTSVQLPPGG